MAWALNQSKIAADASVASGTSVTVVTNVVVAAGDWIVIAIRWTGAFSITTVTDNGPGYTWNRSSSSSTTPCTGIIWVRAQTGLPSGTTITINFAGSIANCLKNGSTFTGGNGAGVTSGSARAGTAVTTGWTSRPVNVKRSNTMVFTSLAAAVASGACTDAPSGTSAEAFEQVSGTIGVSLVYKQDGGKTNAGTVTGTTHTHSYISIPAEAADSAPITPTFVQAGTGATIATGSGAVSLATSTLLPVSAGNLIMLHVISDGAGAQPAAPTGVTNIEALDGTDNSFTLLAQGNLGAALGRHQVYVGRVITDDTNVSCTMAVNAAGDDIYMRLYEFAGVSESKVGENGVWENIIAGSSGGVLQATGNTTSVADAGVQTNGANRLALNLLGIDNDDAVAAYTGMTGGTWAEATAEYSTATGTDGCLQLQTAAMAAAGTINGGSQTIAIADNWGIMGFALLPITPRSLVVMDRNRQNAYQQLTRWSS